MANFPSKKPSDREEIINHLGEDLFEGLSVRKASFVREYLKTFNAQESAQACGYTKGGSRTTAIRFLKDPLIKEAIAKVKAAIAKETEYTHGKCVEEVDYYIREAHRMKQMNALANLVKIKAQLTGHLVEKMDVNLNAKGSFSVQIIGVKPPAYAEEKIDVTPLPLSLDATKKTD